MAKGIDTACEAVNVHPFRSMCLLSFAKARSSEDRGVGERGALERTLGVRWKVSLMFHRCILRTILFSPLSFATEVRGHIAGTP